MSSGTFDVAAGADSTTVNNIAASLYQAVPSVFAGTIDVGQDEIASVTYKIAAPPTFSLQPSATYRAELRKGWERIAHGRKVGDSERLIDQSSQASFDATFPTNSLTITYTSGSQTQVPQCSIVAPGTVTVNQVSTISFQLAQGATISVPANPKLGGLLTDFFAPLLIDYLNKNILSAITLPPLSLGGVKFSLPVVVVQSDTVVVYTAIAPELPVPPSSAFDWPSGVAFLSADAAAINAVANAAAAKYLPVSGHWTFSDAVILLKAHYSAGLADLNIDLVPGQGDIVQFDAQIAASAKFYASADPFHANFTATVSGSAGASAAVAVEGNEVVITFSSLDEFDAKFQVSTPWWFPLSSSAFDSLLDSLAGELASSIGGALEGQTFSVFSVPTISFSVAGLDLQITLMELALSTIAGPGQPLLTVTGTAMLSQQNTVTKVTCHRLSAGAGRAQPSPEAS